MDRIYTHEFLEVLHLNEQCIKVDKANSASYLNQTLVFYI